MFSIFKNTNSLQLTCVAVQPLLIRKFASLCACNEQAYQLKKI